MFKVPRVKVAAPPVVAPKRRARRVTGIYCLIGCAWILLSDLVVLRGFGSHVDVTIASAIKGLAFVLVTSLILYGVLRQSFGAIEQATQAREAAFRELINRLALASDMRDRALGHHGHRLMEYVRVVAQQMGLGQQEVAMLVTACQLHDVGKLGIGDDILLKTGPLTHDERQRMQRHTVIGAKLLEGSAAPELVIAHEIALNHHEWFNGKGYPHGRKGKEIPASARLVSVCDVFDALTSVRTYKDAWSFDEAIAYIQDQKGAQFDPDVVDAFLAVQPQIREIYDQFASDRLNPCTTLREFPGFCQVSHRVAGLATHPQQAASD